MARVLPLGNHSNTRGRLEIIAEASLDTGQKVRGYSPITIALKGTWTGTLKVKGKVAGSGWVDLPNMTATAPTVLTFSGVIDEIAVVEATGLWTSGSPEAYCNGAKGSDS